MMKKTLLLVAILFFATALSAQKKGYWSNASITPSFKPATTVTVGVLPVISPETGIDGIAMNEIITVLSGCSKFKLVGKQQMTEAVNQYRFGGGQVDAGDYANICKATGAQYLVYCELSRDKSIIKKKEVGTVMAWIQLLDAADGFTSVYTGKARTLNPLSPAAETEGAVRKALELLVTKMQ